MILFVAVAAMMPVASSAIAEELVAMFDIGTRQDRDLPIVVVRFEESNNDVVYQMVVQRCDTDSLLHLFIESLGPGTDSPTCWVRINNHPRSASF